MLAVQSAETKSNLTSESDKPSLYRIISWLCTYGFLYVYGYICRNFMLLWLKLEHWSMLWRDVFERCSNNEQDGRQGRSRRRSIGSVGLPLSECSTTDVRLDWRRVDASGWSRSDFDVERAAGPVPVRLGVESFVRSAVGSGNVQLHCFKRLGVIAFRDICGREEYVTCFNNKIQS